MSLATTELFIPYQRESTENEQSRLLDRPGQDTKVTAGFAQVEGGGIVHYAYEEPLEFYTDPTAAVIVHGFIGVESSYRKLRHNIAQSGKPAVTTTPVRHLPLKATLSPNYLLKPRALSAQATRAVISDVQRKQEAEKIDLVVHSMGGMTGTEVASEHPEDVRSITYLASIGLEENTLFSLTRSVPAFIVQEILPDLLPGYKEHDLASALEALGMAPEVIRYIWTNLYQTGAECTGLSRDIRPAMVNLGKAGIKIAILNFASDKLTRNKTTKAKVGPHVDYCETHPREDLAHLAPYHQPQVVSDSVVSIIDKITRT